MRLNIRLIENKRLVEDCGDVALLMRQVDGRGSESRHSATNIGLLSVTSRIPLVSRSALDNQLLIGTTMKVLVIGAAGRTGRLVVEQATSAGHEVTALVRRADEYKVNDVRIFQGDATNQADMDSAVIGQDAVVDAAGSKSPWKTTSLESTIAEVTIESMRRHNVHRLVVISMAGQGDSMAVVPIYERFLFSTMLRGDYKDKAKMESAVRSSGLDWIVVRPPFLTNGDATQNVRVLQATLGDKAHTLPRRDLASFLVAQLSQDDYLRKSVAIGHG